MGTTTLDLLRKAVKSLEQYDDLRDINQDEAWDIEHKFRVHAYEERFKTEFPNSGFAEVFDSGCLTTSHENMGDVNYTERY
jgi:hypothetical protein